jgi:predicted alpha/beta-fold hydrolase
MVLVAALASYLGRRQGLRLRLLFPTSFALAAGLYYRFQVIETAKVKCQRTFWNVQITEKAQLTQMPFCPTFWGFNRHAQTVTCLLFSAIEWLWAAPIEFTCEKVTAYDGNQLNIHWARNPDAIDEEAWLRGAEASSDTRAYTPTMPQPVEDATPVMVLVHGLGDDRFHPYILRFTRMCHECGWKVAVHSYWRLDFGEARDLRAVINHIRKMHPLSPIVAVAWSAGGHHLLKYLQDCGKDTPLVAAISLAGCFDFVQAVTDVKANENAGYTTFLQLQAKRCAWRHMAADKVNMPVHREPFNAIVRDTLDPLRLYDQFIYNLPEYSNKAKQESTETGAPEEYQPFVNTANHYANRAGANMHKVQVTTLILHAEDDPVVSPAHTDWQSVVRNKHIILMRTKRGGHVGWYEGMFPWGTTWDARVCRSFISAVLESHSQTNFLIDVLRRALPAMTKSPSMEQIRGVLNSNSAGSLHSLSHKDSLSSNESPSSSPRPAAEVEDETVEYETGQLPPMAPERLARICSASDVAALAFTQSNKRRGGGRRGSRQ